jgi:hypothetical protein
VGSEIISNVGFRGYNGAATPPLACIPTANYEPNTDVFFVRYGAPHSDDLAVADTSRLPLNGAPQLPDAPTLGTAAVPGVGDQPVDSVYLAALNKGEGVWLRTVLGRRALLFDQAQFNSGTLPNDVS